MRENRINWALQMFEPYKKFYQEELGKAKTKKEVMDAFKNLMEIHREEIRILENY